MTYNRRVFLKNGGLLLSGVALSGISNAIPTDQKLKKFGLQLYTLREELPKDPKGVLKQAASYGYKQFENFESKDFGLFWGMKNTEYKKYLDGLGVTMVSSHCDTDKDFDRKAAECSEIGMKYLLRPYVGPQKTADDFKKYADKFNEWGDVCKKHGIRFAYHNHGYSFKPVDGQIPMDILIKNTNPDTVDFEMDIYWVVTAGADPVEWLKKYPKRFKLCHIKDRRKGAAPTDDDASVDLGTGSIDFRKTIKTAEETGMKYYIVEQERYDNTTPLKSAETDANYLKKFTY